VAPSGSRSLDVLVHDGADLKKKCKNVYAQTGLMVYFYPADKKWNQLHIYSQIVIVVTHQTQKKLLYTYYFIHT
jgi:hypothetical protein